MCDFIKSGCPKYSVMIDYLKMQNYSLHSGVKAYVLFFVIG